jgi:tRNA 2-thiouridine synthesizing protein E
LVIAAAPIPPGGGTLKVGDREVALGYHGYLLVGADWDEAVAVAFAMADGVCLTAAHWEILCFLRDYFAEFGLTPNLRILSRAIARRLGAEKATRAYLYALFPNGPGRQGALYAGLPKPPSCL